MKFTVKIEQTYFLYHSVNKPTTLLQIVFFFESINESDVLEFNEITFQNGEHNITVNGGMIRHIHYPTVASK